MSVYLLDTDTCVFILQHNPTVLRRFAALSPDDVAVATMTEAELYYEARKARDPQQARTDVDAFLLPIARLHFDSDAAEHHAEVRFALGATPIGERDLVIASVALGNAAIVVTHNRRHFARVPGLTLEDWVGSA